MKKVLYFCCEKCYNNHVRNNMDITTLSHMDSLELLIASETSATVAAEEWKDQETSEDQMNWFQS